VELGLFGINIGMCAYDPALLARVTAAAEAAGWESVWTGEHYVLPEPPVAASPARGSTPMLDPFVALAFVAANSERLKVGTGVTVVPLHQPLALAKRVASVDRVSNGRFLFGVGVGYLEPEFRAVGAPLDHRGDRMMESLAAMQTIWSEGPQRFDGSYISFEGVQAEPRPVTPPPLHFGGYVSASFERAVEHGHGWYGFALDLAATEQCIGELRRAASGRQRPAHLPPLEISITPHPSLAIDKETVVAFADLGVTRLIVLPPREANRDPDELLRFVAETPSTL
jgi:probable F420-dependent oxidoreductase